jgi:uncharacterized protein (TIGR02186 family)
MTRLLAPLCLALVFVSADANAAKDEPLVADLSENFIRITTGFTGARVLLFGATQGEGKVVVIVRGPPKNISVRRKDEVAGVWINRREVRFGTVPSFYYILSSEPLGDWLPAKVRKRYEIGLEYLNVVPIGAKTAAEHKAFREALIRNMQRMNRFGEDDKSIKFVNDKLFRADLNLPANVPTGNYNVDVMLIENGKVRSIQITPLQVRKAGIEAQIYRMAYDYPALYGVAAIIIAVIAGLLANAAFRKT